MTHYSDAEKKLIAYFGFTDISESTSLVPAVLYPMMASKAFVDNDRTPAADALRRAIVALERRSVYRETPEWDSLIAF